MTVSQADPVLARNCNVCRGWGTVIAGQGSYELCKECQTGAEKDERALRAPHEASHALWVLWQRDYAHQQ
jgi:hypothetical protein